MPDFSIQQLKEIMSEVANQSFEAKIAPLLNREPPEYIKALLEQQVALTRPPEKQKATGTSAARAIMALAASKGDPGRAAAFAQAKWGEDDPTARALTKALSSADATAGGFLLQDEIAADIIELLRPASVVLAMNPLQVPLDGGTLRMPKHTTGSTGSWIGENSNATATQPVFGQVVLSAKKYASLVPISNDLIRRAAAATETVVRDDLVGDIAAATDLAYIRGDGTLSQPKGMRNQAVAANVLTMTGTDILADMTTDLGIMLQTLLDADVRMIRPGWIMEPRTWMRLFTVQNGNGFHAFKPEMESGRLFGIPFRITSQIPRNLGGGADETELYLADFADVIVGQATQIMLDVSDTAAYHDGANVVAAFSQDQTVIRAIVEVDLGVRHAESVVVLTALTWGA